MKNDEFCMNITQPGTVHCDAEMNPPLPTVPASATDFMHQISRHQDSDVVDQLRRLN